MSKLLLLLLLPLPVTSLGQDAVTVSPQQCVWHAGDNTAWAAPSFNDSAWQPYSKWKIDARTPRIWIRCHTSLTPLWSLDRPALEVHFLGASQVFVNGSQAGSSGNLDSAQFSMGAFYMVPITLPSVLPSVTLALRIAFRDQQTQTLPAEILLGDRSALQDRRAAVALSGALGYLPIGLCFALIGVFGFLLLGLYVSDRSRLELLLLAAVCWCLCVLRLSEFCQYALVPMPYAVYSVLYASGQVLEFFFVWFVFRIAGKRIPWFYRITIAITFTFAANVFADAFLPPLLNLRQNALYTHAMSFIFLGGALCGTAPFAAFWPWKRIPYGQRAISFFTMAWGCADFLWFMNWELFATGFASSDLNLQLQKYLLILRASTTFCSVLALLTIFFREQRRIAQDRAQLAGEMASAREIQQYLIPEKLPATAGLNIHSVYNPSREVGGDFFQVLPDTRDGSTLIVVGDVAGKGLKAGMLAALIVGAIRTAFKFTSDPTRILALLNERLQGRGLVTCLALRIGPDGEVVLANAGHLPPYINGKELALDGALPLGALADLSFPVLRFKMNDGQSMLLVSDGVVEAQSATGELFGFDRTREISSKSAEEIAHAAQAFGQEDDITVLTLQFTPAEVANA